MNKDVLTVSQWIEDLLAATRDAEDGAITIEELSDQLGRSKPWVRECLREFERRGLIRIECTRRRVRRLDGETALRPAYRISRVHHQAS